MHYRSGTVFNRSANLIIIKTSCMATAENIYFLRSFLLLDDGGLYITRHILEREIESKKGEGDLDKILKRCENKLKHEFHGKQYKKLFPRNGYTDIYRWDLQLSVGVLITVFGHTLSLTEKQNLRSLRDLRNDIYMQSSSASLDQDKYEDVQEQLKVIITSLATTFDEAVKEKCSRIISQHTTGPLDGVKPSSAKLNEVSSKACQTKSKVDVHAEFVVGEQSDHWINLCDRTLYTLFNKTDSVTSVEEIEKNVRKMLDFVQANRGVVFKEMGNLEKKNQFEISSKEGINETEQSTREMTGSDNELCNMIESNQSLRLEVECASREGMLQTLSSFKKEEILDHITSAADALSRNEQKKALKATLNEKDVMEAIEESADWRFKALKHSSHDVDKAQLQEHAFLCNSETYTSIDQPSSQPSYQTYTETLQKRVRMVKVYAWMKEEMELSKARSIADHLFQHEPRMLTNYYHEYIHSLQRRKEAVECLLKKVLLGPDGIYDVFRDALDPDDDEHILMKLDEEPVNESDIKAFMELNRSSYGSVLILNREEPLLTFTKKNRRSLELYLHDRATIDSINDNFLSRFIFRIDEHTNIADTTLDVKRKLKRLLATMNLCSETISKDFCEILELESVGMSYVIDYLDGKEFGIATSRKKEKRRSSSTIDDDLKPTSTKKTNALIPNKQSNIVRTLNQPGSNMRNKALVLGVIFDQAEEG